MGEEIPETELLVTFEVIARHESYTRAIEELVLTQSAVFRQVNALKDFLNTALFNHAKRRIFLDAAGKHYLSTTKEALNKFERDTTTTVAWQLTVQVTEPTVNPAFSTR